MASWLKQRVLITVRTYPVPAKKGVEVSCTAGITDEGKWIRLFPVPYRFLEPDQRFRKYQWIEVDTTKATNDPRPESYKLNADSIKIGEFIPASDNWRARRDIVRPLLNLSFCELQRARETAGSPTLGLIKPIKIKRLTVEHVSDHWTESELATLNQLNLFQKNPTTPLEKLPLIFRYEFKCSPTCGGHECACTDWEMGESYRKWRKTYGDNWERAFRNRYEGEMIEKFDTHFFVGNLHQFPNAWIIVGLFYPPKQKQSTPDLFDF